ncbi:type II toxin-antitoxin system Phd/YefM family antitoxin [Candidatus Frankia alpina]|uniref:Type II toxin-antitoxin system prevent-host-death family antitoxin n=1 Tax=Candidatus Frankia alpina TaxID=2699483 RepID=A0A4S5CZ40_9ACTN|nr:type II toxin-antitoxin system prevent-host-death family antitoxin [Candidatus Frankia alpina]THJ49168.1 type II toxin-antitoxin system prevent-host-death family antitoxin [Candidatus Frankia alpina]
MGSWVDRAHAGESIIITRNGRPWARLVPELTQTGSDYLDQLVAQGRVTVPTAGLADLPEPVPTGGWDGRDSTDVVAELREESA